MIRGVAAPRRKGKGLGSTALAVRPPGRRRLGPWRRARLSPAGRGSAAGSRRSGRKGPGRAWLRRGAGSGAAMSCLREEDDPYVVEEPSDEERALSRCLELPAGVGGLGPRSPPGVCWPGRAAVPSPERRGSRTALGAHPGLAARAGASASHQPRPFP